MLFDHFENMKWKTGSGDLIDFKEVALIVSRRSDNGCKIFIGSDSFITNGLVCFSTAICLHGDDKGGRYFFTRIKEKTHHYKNLTSRITEEVRRSIELAEFLINYHDIEPECLELHLDVSPFHSKNATAKLSEMLRGYVNGFGLECRLKPNAWASQSVADRHSK